LGKEGVFIERGSMAQQSPYLKTQFLPSFFIALYSLDDTLEHLVGLRTPDAVVVRGLAVVEVILFAEEYGGVQTPQVDPHALTFISQDCLNQLPQDYMEKASEFIIEILGLPGQFSLFLLWSVETLQNKFVGLVDGIKTPGLTLELICLEVGQEERGDDLVDHQMVEPHEEHLVLFGEQFTHKYTNIQIELSYLQEVSGVIVE
jgi:hypothetical protein